jgi:hypothetical protein
MLLLLNSFVSACVRGAFTHVHPGDCEDATDYDVAGRKLGACVKLLGRFATGEQSCEVAMLNEFAAYMKVIDYPKGRQFVVIGCWKDALCHRFDAHNSTEIDEQRRRRYNECRAIAVGHHQQRIVKCVVGAGEERFDHGHVGRGRFA